MDGWIYGYTERTSVFTAAGVATRVAARVGRVAAVPRFPRLLRLVEPPRRRLRRRRRCEPPGTEQREAMRVQLVIVSS